MALQRGDRVHISRLGGGIVREVRSGGRYVVEIKGRTMIVGEAQVEPAEQRAGKRRAGGSGDEPPPGGRTEAAADANRARDDRTPARETLDLHGKTVDEAILALDEFLDEALLASLSEVQIIHGRSGTRIKDAVHRRLRQLPPARAFRVDPRNAGVTIVRL